MVALCVAACLGLATIAAAATAEGTAAKDAESPAVVWMVIPTSGRPSALLRWGADALTRAGLKIETPDADGVPDVLIVYARALADQADTDAAAELVREGSGLVLIYSLAEDLTSRQRDLLELWGVTLDAAKPTTGQTTLKPHPITQGISNLFCWRVGATLKGVTPLLVQGKNVIGGVAERGGIRLAVLPLDAVVPGQKTDAIPAPNLQLLAQAARWVANRGSASAEAGPAGDPAAEKAAEGAKTAAAGASSSGGIQTAVPAPASGVSEPAESTPLPAAPGLKREGFNPTAYVDMSATDEDWPAIKKATVALLDGAGLKVHDVQELRVPQSKRSDSEPGQETSTLPVGRLPLLRALRDNPALVVLGSCRQYDEREAVALAAYVRSGGALLALPRGTNRTNERIVELNLVLEKFGMSCLLGRPSGAVALTASPIVSGLKPPAKIEGGVNIIGYLGDDLAKVGNYAVARVEQYGTGRLAVVDPVPLFEPKKDQAAAEAWQGLIRHVLRWLTAGMDIKPAK